MSERGSKSKVRARRTVRERLRGESQERNDRYKHVWVNLQWNLSSLEIACLLYTRAVLLPNAVDGPTPSSRRESTRSVEISGNLAENQHNFRMVVLSNQYPGLADGSHAKEASKKVTFVDG